MELNKITMEIFSKLEQQWLFNSPQQPTQNPDAKKTKILTIDGGDTSAFIAGAFLVHLEGSLQSKLNDPTIRIADFFDLISGTGVGGLLAVLLSAANPAGRPMFSALEAVKFLSDYHDLLLPRRRGLFHRQRRSSGDLLGRILRGALKEKTLKDTCNHLLVPCYNVATSAPFVFSRAAASASAWTTLDFELWNICAAAVAAPAYFEPVKVNSIDRKTDFTAVDGGVVMNNPAAAAVTHVLHNKTDFPTVNGVDDLLVLSLGNGTLSCRGSSEKWGGSSRKLVRCVVDAAVDGVSETVDQMLGNAFSWNRNDYVRIQANGFDGSGEMTKEAALKEKGIESLSFGGKRLLAETNQERIDGFVQRLVTSSTRSSLPPSPYKSLSPLLDGR